MTNLVDVAHKNKFIAVVYNHYFSGDGVVFVYGDKDNKSEVIKFDISYQLLKELSNELNKIFNKEQL